ncbi:MAG: ABC transporter permease [Eubacterium sp.]|nr:ABC transporter permease [Eubacterium sp.]
MHTYKIFFKVMLQHKISLIMYFLIMVFMLIAFTQGQSDQSMGSFSSSKFPIIVVDEDDSEISEALVSYLGEIHTLKEGTYTDDQIKSMLYYTSIAEYIVIPKGFGDSFDKLTNSGKKDDIEFLNLLDATYDDARPRGIFINMQINEFLNGVADYISLGESLEEALKKSESSIDVDRFVAVQEKETDSCERIYSSFTFLPFGILSIIFSGVLSVIISFNEKEKKNRTIVSSVKMTNRNFALVMGALTIAVLVTSLLIFIISFNASFAFVFTKTWWLSVLNAFIYTLSITLMISMLTSLPLGINKKGTDSVSSFLTCILALSFGFLGGTFVDLTILGDDVAKIGRFIPNYWYSVASRKIWYGSADISDLLDCFGFQILFGFACLSIGLVFTKFFGSKSES